MTHASLAKIINQQSSYYTTLHTLAEQAEKAGLVMAFGVGDDTLMMLGAIQDELVVSEGSVALFDEEGLLPTKQQIVDSCEFDYDDEYLNEFMSDLRVRQAKAMPVESRHCASASLPWSFITDIPHSAFTYRSSAAGEAVLSGIVFALSSIPTALKQLKE